MTNITLFICGLVRLLYGLARSAGTMLRGVSPLLIPALLAVTLTPALAQSALTAETLAALPWPLAAGAKVADPVTLARLVQDDFQACGQEAQPDKRLNVIAGQMLRGFKLSRDLFSAQGFPVKSAGTLVLPKLAAWEKVRDVMANQCGNRLGYSRFGVAVEGGRAALVYARLAEVDLSHQAAWNAEMLALINGARRQGQRCGDTLYNATHPLLWSGALASAATQQADELPQVNYRGHINPSTGSTPNDRVQAAGWPNPEEVGETLAYDALTPQEALKTLLASPSHCKIIMNPAWTHVGTDLSNGTATSTFTTYWVQVFSRQR